MSKRNIPNPNPNSNMMFIESMSNVCHQTVYSLDPREIKLYNGSSAFRDKSSLSPAQKRAIEFITTSPGTLPVGSFKFKAFHYPSDIDLFEVFQKCCSINKVRLELTNKLIRIAERVKDNLANPYPILLGDFKAGYDERYKVYLGRVINGKPFDVYPDIILNEFNNMYNQRLLTRLEYNNLVNLLNGNLTETFPRILEFFKEKRVIRWSLDELLKGYKDLPEGKRLYLYDALISGSVVKIDLWIYIDGRYVEVTNWLLVSVVDSTGKEEILSEPLPEYVSSLSADVVNYYNDGNFLKASKRAWNLAYVKRNTAMLANLAPVFNSYPALLGSVSSDLTVAKDIITRYPEYTDYVKSTFENVSKRLENYKICGANLQRIQSNNNELVRMIKGLINIKDYNSLIENIDYLIEFMSNSYNNLVKTYLDIKGINLLSVT